MKYFGTRMPYVDEQVIIQMKELKDDYIECYLPEFETDGIINFVDLTRKKIRNPRNFFVKTFVSAQVINVDSKNNIITLSRKYNTEDDDKAQEAKFRQHQRIISTFINCMRTIDKAVLEEKDVQEFWNNKITCLLSDDDDFNITDFSIKLKECNDGQLTYFATKLEDNFINKEIKLCTKFIMFNSNNYSDLKNLLVETSKKYSNVEIKLDAIPNYYIESNTINKDSEQELHNEILEDLQQKAHKLGMNFSY